MEMETLDGTEWDVVIADTGFASSLLALALSRSGKRVLHLDPHEYYGGTEAALSLSEAESWANIWAQTEDDAPFSHASVSKLDADTEGKLASSRAYSVALAPHLIYARSNVVTALVSSQCHSQLDFQAVGSWYVLEWKSQGQSALLRVPSSREDVFQDAKLDLKAKRSLMKFLRFVGAYEDQPEVWQAAEQQSFPAFLLEKFNLPSNLQAPILALTMLPRPQQAITTGAALSRIAHHLRSIGVFGPGFSAVLPKWGGLAEIAQVACRACAVGGGVYVLKKRISSFTDAESAGKSVLELEDGEKITTDWLCGSQHAIPANAYQSHDRTDFGRSTRSVSIVSSALSSLFPPTSEGGVTPAGAVVVSPGLSDSEPPVQIFIHTSEAGECPMNQSVVYASVALPHETGLDRLEQAVSALLNNLDSQDTPGVLWRLQYEQREYKSDISRHKASGKVLSLPQLPSDLVVGDSVVESVKHVWQHLTGEDDQAFFQFAARQPDEDTS